MTSKLTRLSFAFLALALALAPALAQAATPLPGTLSFSARVADSGRPVTGSHVFIFRFWDCDGTDTTACVAPSAHVLWEETQTLTVSDGVVTAALGSDNTTPNTFPPVLFNGQDRWFSVTMDGTNFGPFMAVRSVPYAVIALTSLTSLTAPRVSGSTRTTAMTIPTTGVCTNYTSTSIYAPAAGTIIVEGVARAGMNHAVASYDYIYMHVSNTTADCGGFGTSAIGYAYSNVSAGYLEFNLPNRVIFPVGGAGTYTFYMNFSYPYAQTGSSATVQSGVLTATYFPN